jgi:hypothetical protein
MLFATFMEFLITLRTGISTRFFAVICAVGAIIVAAIHLASARFQESEAIRLNNENIPLEFWPIVAGLLILGYLHSKR